MHVSRLDTDLIINNEIASKLKKSSLTIECRLNIDIILDIFNSNQHVFIYIPCENRPKLPYSGSCHNSKLVLLADEHQFIPKSINSYQESMCCSEPSSRCIVSHTIESECILDVFLVNIVEYSPFNKDTIRAPI